MDLKDIANIEKQKIEKALESKDVEKIYFNGFSTSIGIGDILITLYKNGEPTQIVNTSFTIAKTLSIKLKELIDVVERKTGHEIMTSDFIQIKLSENENK